MDTEGHKKSSTETKRADLERSLSTKKERDLRGGMEDVYWPALRPEPEPLSL